MATRDQALLHHRMRQEDAAQQAALAQQAQAAQAQQQYGVQSALSAQGASQQAALATHQHGLQSQAAEQHVDLQARLHEVTLQQEEQQRMRKMYNARASIEDNADLAPFERRMLLTQLESGLNPLENRQRESGMLTQHLQQQAIAQQNQQGAELFNHRMGVLRRGAAERMETVTDPQTGQSEIMQLQPDGTYVPLNFDHSREMAQARLQATQAQTQATQQGTQQSAEAHPLQMQNRQLANEQLQQTIGFARDIHPLDVRRLGQANELMAQHIEQGPATFNLAQLRGYADLAGLQQTIGQRIAEQPHSLSLLSANAQIAQARAAAEPTNTALAQEAQRANIAHTQAVTTHTDAIVRRMPSVQQAQAQHGAESQHATDTAAIARITLNRMQAGGLPDGMARDVTNHAITSVDREIAHAEAEVQRMIPGTEEYTRERARLEGLRRNRNNNIQLRANDAEDLMRQQTGMPASERPARPQRAEQENPGEAAFQQLDQQVAAMPPAQRQVVQPALARLRMLRAAHPGGFATMPPDMQREVMQLIERVRTVQPAGQGQGPPAPGFLQGINQRFGGG